MMEQRLGAENPKRAVELTFKATLLILALMTAVALVIYLLKKDTSRRFVDDLNIFNENERFLQILTATLLFSAFRERHIYRKRVWRYSVSNSP